MDGLEYESPSEGLYKYKLVGKSHWKDTIERGASMQVSKVGVDVTELQS
jgi:hypothetical protein